jgi:hypothetical protein
MDTHTIQVQDNKQILDLRMHVEETLTKQVPQYLKMFSAKLRQRDPFYSKSDQE